MIYAIRHVTKYAYDQLIQENLMEVRKHPLSNERQRCLNFSLTLEPEVRVFRYQDHLGNQVHHFDVPWLHQEVTLIGESVMEVRSESEEALPLSWTELRRKVQDQDFYDLLEETPLVVLSDHRQFQVEDFATPLALAEHAAAAAHRHYIEGSAEPGEQPRRQASRECAHALLAELRKVQIPCRYISGYRISQSQESLDTSHAWVEAYVTESGWLGIDPSQPGRTDSRYITNCVGRDYSDCPPTRGIYRGGATSRLQYAVHVRPAEEPAREDRFVTI
jgi:transglutaminase-like putative cysteine protease